MLKASSCTDVPGVFGTRVLRGYEAYRGTGVEWLNSVPKHWELKRLEHIASYRTSSVDKKTDDAQRPIRLCNYTDVYYQDRIRASDGDFMEATASPQEISRFKLRAGDILITKDSEDWKDIAVPALIDETADDFVCGYHLGIIRPGPMARPGFIFRAMQSVIVNQQLQVSASGVTRYGLPNAAVGDALMPLPPLNEQRAIVTFLDRETERIDALVEKKRRLIERLREYRTALITRTVTRGLPPEAARAADLDPSSRMKPSGVEWLGDVPVHWEVKRLRDVAVLINGYPFDSELFDQYEGVPLVRIRDLFTPATEVKWSGDPVPEAEIGDGDILIGMDGDFNVAWWTHGPALLNQRLCCARAQSAFASQRFLFYCLPFPLKALNDVTYATTVKHLSSLDVLKFRLPLPPLYEQRAIASFLDRETERIDVLSEKAEIAIERLQEHRTALITAAVTGKIDVREVTPEPVAATTAA